MTDGPDAPLPISKGSLRSARRLLSRRGREESGLFLVEGAQAVREALAWPGRVTLVATCDPVRDAVHLDAARARGARTAVLGPDEVEALSETVTSQGLFAVCQQVASDDLPDIAQPWLVVICAQVRDPGNAGTVIRCADAFGADAVILTRGSVDPHNPKTVRSSVGSVFHLPVIVGVELEDAVSWAHGHGMQVLAADGGGSSLDELGRTGRLTGPTAWIMGNEAWGLPEAERSLADDVVGVPMWGAAESLNLSTAAAVCLYATASAQRS
ncbi:TrmH family RNA methyltransferase [Acidipropionibacterium timonense]|uniref:TrmH family RNA methyltransferase n=1 Tax=Acidipropionibacterium timonense TaxID=2161818 RepID=UPI001031FDF4|nr:RNA methyltransferase [Acidipropionibacterium timonense]